MPQAAADRRFVPIDLDPSDWNQLQPLYQALLDRPLETVHDVNHWLADVSELTAAVSEYAARTRINQACHTDDAEVEKVFMHWVEQIAPKIQPLFFELQKKLLATPAHAELPEDPFAVLLREWRADVELFRPQNVPLQTQVTKLVSQYDKLIGAMTVEFQGQTRTLQQLARFLEEPDREVRQEAWVLSAERRLQDRDDIEDVFDQTLKLRQEIATNADLPDYRAYTWKGMGRFDYTPQDCLTFADAIADVCVPLVNKLDEQRREKMGLAKLRPWDLSVDPQGRPALRPFDPDQPKVLLENVTRMFERLSPELAADFAKLEEGRNLDLQSRRGKRAGGFQSALEESGEPFIFMNSAGLQRDVETLLHEGGHAFHFVWATEREPLVFLRHAPLEFCEVASMSMELMASYHLDVFYKDQEQFGRARRTLLEGIVRFFPWMAIIDSFQHWIYTHPGHTATERRDHWLSLLDRFQSDIVDWSGHEPARAWMWHRQLHLFHHPFYYVEYGIAQLGALQMWANFRQDREQALHDYRAALTLGGRKPLPELFEAANLKFDFTKRTLQPLMQDLWAEIQALPE